MVNNFLFKDRDGQTPLPPELRKGLKPKYIQNIGELDEHEEENIAEGLAWLQKCNENGLTYNFWQKLHKKLFEKVWSWAGEIRKHELDNLYFLSAHQIWPEFKKLEDDLNYWIESKEISTQEIAARFHEKIETIHPFAKGNGRFGRILIEYFCRKSGEKIPTWGSSLKSDPSARRQIYIEALNKTRQTRTYNDLIKFMFS
ncbi:MAG TPA: mobile mystery protein B [Pseudobdellovibrionaceae bacterium]|jgi:Fic-DOC domain mobile mystery protein B|nr:mobile mystery protein B [Pseudobdellovibrionaceae bacterium]